MAKEVHAALHSIVEKQGSMSSHAAEEYVQSMKLHTILDNYGIANSFEIYSGTHVSAVADRFQNHVLPFFSKNLCFTADCR